MATPNSPSTEGTAGPMQSPDTLESEGVETPTTESSAPAQLDPSFWLNYALIASGLSTLAAVGFIIWGVGAESVTLVAVGLAVFFVAATLWGATFVIVSYSTLRQLWLLARPHLRRRPNVRPDGQDYVHE